MLSYRFVILGGGMVAGYAARELVELGVAPGDLCIISSDRVLPYERPPLSKGFLAGRQNQASIQIGTGSFYRDHGIKVRLRTTVERVDLVGKRVAIRSGRELGFDKLVVATGAQVRRFDSPGSDLDGVLYLRSLDDAKRIRSMIEGTGRAVVVGAGFIGMEVASVLAQKGIETTMVYPEPRVWERFFTPEMSAFFHGYFESHGARLLAGENVAAFEGAGRVSAVVLGSGARLPAETVIAGIGVIPSTEVGEEAGLTTENGIVTNEYLETSAPDVYAAGDVAAYWDVIFAKRRRVEHWDNAVEQGKHVAHLLMGDRRPFVHVPYFFSDVFDLSYEFWGDSEGADEVGYRGTVGAAAFSVWWLRKGQTVAAFIMNRPDEEREMAPQLIEAHRPPPSRFLESAHNLIRRKQKAGAT